MPSGWDVYYIVFLSALLGLGIPAFVKAAALLLSLNVSPKNQAKKNDLRESPVQPGLNQVNEHSQLGRRINIRFFLGVNASFILIAMGMVILPCIGTLHEKSVRGLIGIVSLAGFTAIGLFYASRKGDLTWLRIFHAPKPGAES